MTRYGVIGVGSIAAAMVVGWCDGVADPPEVVLSPRSAERSAELAARFATVRVADDNQAVVDAADVVVVCLLPGNAAEVLAGLRFRPDQAVVSAVAGLDVAHLREVVAPATDVARSIPLPAVATRESVTPVHPATPAVEELFGRLGGSLVVERRAGVRVDRRGVGDGRGVLRLPRHRSPTGSPTAGIAGPEARRYVADTFAALSGELGAAGGRLRARWPTRTRRRAGSTSSSRATSARPGCTTRCAIGLDAVLREDCPELKHVLVSGA